MESDEGHLPRHTAIRRPAPGEAQCPTHLIPGKHACWRNCTRGRGPSSGTRHPAEARPFQSQQTRGDQATLDVRLAPTYLVRPVRLQHVHAGLPRPHSGETTLMGVRLGGCLVSVSRQRGHASSRGTSSTKRMRSCLYWACSWVAKWAMPAGEPLSGSRHCPSVVRVGGFCANKHKHKAGGDVRRQGHHTFRRGRNTGGDRIGKTWVYLHQCVAADHEALLVGIAEGILQR